LWGKGERMTEINDAIRLVQDQNKARLYETRLRGLQKQNLELTSLVKFITDWLVENVEDEGNDAELTLRADSADLLHKIEEKLKKIKP
tara:strand:+ start:2335 stop:2598 length:264 start_codon:yes stop_codon:yes gene_type:complete